MTSIESKILIARRHLRQLIAVKAHHIRLTGDQLVMINTLREIQPVSLGKLAKAMRYDNPTMSRMVAEMVAKDLVVSAADPDHGRRIRISLTAAGDRLVYTEILAINADLARRSLEGMDPTEEAALHHLLDKYNANLAAMSAVDLPGVPLRMPLAS